MTGKRKRYSAEFKAKVSLEAICGESTEVPLVAKHGVHHLCQRPRTRSVHYPCIAAIIFSTTTCRRIAPSSFS